MMMMMMMMTTMMMMMTFRGLGKRPILMWAIVSTICLGG
jgi:hypothetical protein